MEVKALLRELRENEIDISLNGDNLQINSDRPELPAHLIEKIRNNKESLVSYLKLNTGDVSEQGAIPKLPVQESYVLSSAQQRLWIMEQFETANAVYALSDAYVFEGTLDTIAFKDSFNELIKRHEILRTVFRENDNAEVRQWIKEFGKDVNPLRISDLRNEKNKQQLVQQTIQSDIDQPFNLAESPLFRACLCRVDENKYVFWYVMHHIITDGWSKGIIIKELVTFYNSFVNKIIPPFSSLRIQYKDYAAWQQEQLSVEASNAHRSHWLNVFGEELPVLELSTDRPRPAVKTYNGGIIRRTINSTLTQQLKDINKESGATLFMCLLSLVNTFLYRYTGQQDIVIGSPAAGRDHRDLEDQVGFYVNMLALRTKFSGEGSFKELLEKVKEVTLGAYEHQVYPFDELVNELNLKVDASRNPLFDVSVVLQNVDISKDAEAQQLGDIRLSTYEGGEQKVSLFDLRFDFKESKAGIEAIIEYNSDLYNASSVERMSDHLVQLLKAIVTSPAAALNSLDYLSSGEKASLIPSVVDYSDYPLKATITILFEDQVKLYPERAALLYEEKSFSYKELNGKANALAAHLRSKYKINSDDLVAICLERSEWMIISILAVLKSGGAYVPVDPSYPQDRIEYMLTDSSCKALINEKELQHFFENEKSYSIENPEQLTKPSSLAYVIYTSGTTGKPKGTLIEHGNVVRLMKPNKPLFDFNENDVWSFFHSYCFDFSVWEMYGALLFGGSVVVVPSMTAKDPVSFLGLLTAKKVTVLNQTPSAFYNLQEAVLNENKEQQQNQLSIRYVIFGGEALQPGKLKSWKAVFPDCKLVNMYGITETTVHVTYKEITEKEIEAQRSNIGIAIPTLGCYVLDEHMQLVPPGVEGELYVSGSGLARGYLNRRELTSERFITDPYNPMQRLYKSGDKVKLLPGGEMEYMGRKDEQVKIRGYRIELGEIEAALQSHPEVESVLILAKGAIGEEKNLVAYVVSKNKRELNVTELRTYLMGLLPSYMIPGYYVALEKMPLTSNGKVDRKALPSPEGMGMTTGSEYVAARNESEAQLVSIWSEVLNIDKEKLSVKDNFFELGGHSLKAIRLSGKIVKQFEVKLSLNSIFASPVLEMQAQLIAEGSRSAYTSIPSVSVQPDYALSSAQRRLWILSRFTTGSTAYNIPGAYIFKGKLQPAILQNAFGKLISRHESLRTIFRENEQGEVRQVIIPAAEFDSFITEKELSTPDKAVVSAQVQSEFSTVFDLQKGPLIKVSLLRSSSDEWIFCYVMHHIISDGWSMEIIVKELLDIYNAEFKKEVYPLQPLRIHYKDYAAWQQEQLSGEALNLHRSYWLNVFGEELPVLELSTDRPRPAVKTYNGGIIRRTINSTLTQQLKDINKESGATLFMGLLSLVNTFLYRYTGQEDIITGSPIAGREHADLENQVGFFVNTLALRTQFSGRSNFKMLLEKVKEVTLGAYEHQIYPFDELVDQLKLSADMSRSALFDVMVTLQNENTRVRVPELPGIQIENYNDAAHITSKFDLLFIFEEHKDALVMKIEYNSDLYNASSVERMSDHLVQLLKAIVTSPAAALNSLDYLSSGEKASLIPSVVDYSDYPLKATITSLFEDQVKLYPERAALLYEEKSFSYKELNGKANALAAHLKSKYKINSDDLVAICLERSEWMIISILAVLKSGGAYVPVDPSYPQDRIEYMLTDSSCKALINEKELQHFFENEKSYSIENPEQLTKPSSLAYVIYTSGTTGKPKGTLIEHGNVVRLMKPNKPLFDFNENDVWSFFHSYCFDFSVWEMYGALLFGGSVVVVPSMTAKDPVSFLGLLTAKKVTVLNQTPSAFYNLQEAVLNENKEQQQNQLSIRYVIFGGEALQPGKLKSWKAVFPDCKLVNMYGITETTVHVTYKEITEKEIEAQRSNIGIAIPTLGCYVLDEHMQLVPPGVEGELYVSGSGLARGYLNRRELTSERFITDPYNPMQRLYKSGDKVKLLPGGEMEYMGRKDEQVKIRGYRIELGEIEAALQSHPEVESVLILAKGAIGEEKNLVAYVVSKNKRELNVTELRTYLMGLLPSYMIPGYYVALEKMPLTSNGKVDRKALPSPEGMGMTTGSEYVAARNETEAQLVSIWSEVLNIDKEKLSVKDNFFELGGHSLKASILLTKISREMNVSFDLKDVFVTPTIENLAEKIRFLAWNTMDETSDLVNLNEIDL